MAMIRVSEEEAFTAYLAVPAGNRKGPGVVLIQEIFGVNKTMRNVADGLAAKGYVAVCPDLFWRQQAGVELSDRSVEDQKRAMQLYEGLDEALAVQDSAAAMAYLRKHETCTGAVGVVGYCLGGKLAYLLATRHDPDAVVSYYGVGIDRTLDEAGKLACPLLLHLAEDDAYCDASAQKRIQEAFAHDTRAVIHTYADQSHAFARPGGQHYHAASAELADLRTWAHLHEHLGCAKGPLHEEPRLDLAAIWEEHIKYEFETRDHEDTLKTMVEDAYVNHIPTLTGGVGKAALREFYAKRFIPQMPPDTQMTPVSRTIGRDRVVDEMIFRFTHTIEMDWMLPGIAPTGRRVEVPLVAIVHIRGDKLAHEHIYWDQASVLVQLGLLDGENLPVMGVETARKVLDNTVPSNALIERADRRKR